MADSGESLGQTLAAVDAGLPQATEKLLPLVYDDLRARARHLMANERSSHTLTPTALVHEAYLKLVDADRGWRSRTHFLSAAAQAMRRILVDHARNKGAAKRGAGWKRAAIENADAALATDNFDWISLDEALDRFRVVDERAHQVVMLRFFAGRTETEIGQMLGIGERQVRREWKTACLWLRQAMDEGAGNG
ncbi:MAG: ECF-type sigma factor [Planctomycetota bacterium]|nr:ECF-type sigma factor [Planctomycetota bacterium]